MEITQTIDPAKLGIRKRTETLTLPDILNMFSEEESLKIAFIPVILTEVEIRYVRRVCEICVENRESRYKKQTRALKALVGEYERDLGNGLHDSSLESLHTQVERYIEDTETDSVKLYFSINGELKRRHPEAERYELYTYAYMARTISAYVRAYESKVDEEIEKRSGARLGRITSPLMIDIDRTLAEITADMPITTTSNINLAMTIIGNKLCQSEFAITD